MQPAPLTLAPFTEGDLWEGIPALSLTVNGTVPASPIEVVTMRFQRAGAVPSVAVGLTSATAGQITIVDAANWIIEVPEQVVASLSYGKWDFQITIKPVGSSKRTYIADTVDVLQTI